MAPSAPQSGRDAHPSRPLPPRAPPPSQVQQRTWPELKVLVAPGPRSEPTRWFRSEAGLPPSTGGKDNLELVLADSTLVQPLCYSMRQMNALSSLPFDHLALCAQDGALILNFLEHFFEHVFTLRDDASPFRTPPVCTPFRRKPDADVHTARIAQDARADLQHAPPEDA